MTHKRIWLPKQRFLSPGPNATKCQALIKKRDLGIVGFNCRLLAVVVVAVGTQANSVTNKVGDMHDPGTSRGNSKKEI
jgi:hypothetical protein